MQNKLIEKIQLLKKQKDAVILAHNYQLSEIQDIADFVGDSLELSIEASKTKAKIIVFCGVNFMAETAKILNPTKKVLMPDKKAGCPMANMINESDLLELKNQNPDAAVVCYINSTAKIKALSDYCCTSGNALQIVKSILPKKIIFVPDQYLGNWIESQLGIKMILWKGYCNVHNKILPEYIIKQKSNHPKALVLAHPECTPEVLKLADKVASTSQMIKFPSNNSAEEYIIATEKGILHKLNKIYPDKKFYPAFDGALCPNMKLTNLEKLLWSLEDEKEEINLEKNIIEKALSPIKRMLEITQK